MSSELGSVWYDCVLVKNSKGELEYYESDDVTNLMRKQLKKYKKENPCFADDDGCIWYDLNNKFCFGSAQYKRWPGTSNLPTKDHSYTCSKDNFIDWSKGFITKAFRENKVFKSAYSSNIIRFFFLQAHYRNVLDISEQALKASE